MRTHRSGMTIAERDQEILGYLKNGQWATCSDLGGRDASHHSGTLARLIKRGLVERKFKGGYIRKNYYYRLKPALPTAPSGEQE